MVYWNESRYKKALETWHLDLPKLFFLLQVRAYQLRAVYRKANDEATNIETFLETKFLALDKFKMLMLSNKLLPKKFHISESATIFTEC